MAEPTPIAHWTAASAETLVVTDLSGFITVPNFTINRGGIQFKQHSPNSPEAVQARERRCRHDKAVAEWEQNPPTHRHGMEVWLAIYKQYDDIELLEVCSSRQRAAAVCAHHARRPLPSRPEGYTIDWEDDGPDIYSGWVLAAEYRIERSEVRG